MVAGVGKQKKGLHQLIDSYLERQGFENMIYEVSLMVGIRIRRIIVKFSNQSSDAVQPIL